MSGPRDLPATWRNVFTTGTGWIAISLVVIELIAGMQTYVTQTVTPLMAVDLHGRRLYGVLTASAQIGQFLTMPIGGALLTRFRASTLLTWLMPVTAAGAALCALASGMPVFIAGTVIRALASGALATVGMGVIVTEMPKAWRTHVLAALSGIWVLSSLVGPAYASWFSYAAGWRWAMVAYLPVFFAARGLIAWQLRSSPPMRRKSALRVPSAFILAGGIALVALFTSPSWWRIVLGAIGICAVAVAAANLMPDGVVRLRRGRPSAIAAMFVLCGVYFGAYSLTAILAHDVLGFSTLAIGVLLGCGGLGWALVGLYCGGRPAESGALLISRVKRAAALMTTGLLFMGASLVLPPPATALAGTIFSAGWVVAGAGMGFGYLDLMNRIAEPHADGINQSQAATAVVLAEAIASALFATVATTSLVSVSDVWGGRSAGIIFPVLACLAVALVPLARRAAAATTGATGGASHSARKRSGKV